MPPSRVVLLAPVALLPVPLAAQVEWRQLMTLPGFTTAAFDDSRSRLLVFAADIWQWDGVAWQLQAGSRLPPATGSAAFAYEPVRQVVVRFAATDWPFPISSTWEWNGTAWRNAAPALQPPARVAFALAADSRRGRVVLFGGRSMNPNGGCCFPDTWEWDGSNWRQMLPAASPPGRSSHAMVDDRSRGRVLLFGGLGSAVLLGDTWSWDGTNWTQHLPAASPSPRSEPALAHDAASGRCVLFGGSDSSGLRNDTWEWDGSNWQLQAPAAAPSPRRRAGMAGDSAAGGVLLGGGVDDSILLGDLWRWSAGSWTQLAPAATPPARHSHAAAFDRLRGRLLVFGGSGGPLLADLWQWDGTAWRELGAANGPSPRARAVMTYDAVRDRAVLFGGELPGFTNETWEWDGVAWALQTPLQAPPPRVLHAMAFDSRRGRVLLFGGTNWNMLGDTWEWDGVSWQQRVVNGPPPRLSHTLAFDSGRGVAVLYGGVGAGQPFGTLLTDTWEWDGVAWTRRPTSVDPGARRDAAMTYDDARGRVVLFGGGAANDVWEWDGSTWSQRATATAPPACDRLQLAYGAGSSLLFGGQTNGELQHFWEYRPVHAAAATPYGLGCTGTAGVPQLAAPEPQLPWLGDRVRLELTAAPPGAAAIWLGFSRSTWASLPLPLDLTPLGLPGCRLLAAIDTLQLLPVPATGAATWNVPVPNLPALLGITAFAQAAVADPAANAFGAALSAALLLRVGGR